MINVKRAVLTLNIYIFSSSFMHFIAAPTTINVAKTSGNFFCQYIIARFIGEERNNIQNAKKR